MKRVFFWFGVLSIGLFSIGVLSAGVFSAGQARASFVELDRVIAVVNNQVITWAELYRAMEFEFGQRISALSDDEKRAFLRKNEKEFLDRMIEVSLETQQAKKLGLSVEEAEINEAIDSIQKKYGLDDAAFRSALRSEGFGMDEYRKRLGEQILVSKLVQKEVRERVLVSDPDVQKYIKENGIKQDEGEAYHIRQVFFPAPQRPEERAAVEEKAKELSSKVRAGGDLEALARDYKALYVDLGLMKADVLAPEFQKAVAGMAPGDVSEPFWMAGGLSLVKLDEKIMPDDASTFQRVKRELQEKLFESEYGAWLKQLKETSFIEIRL
jgi:peptidyl-prolyl cis-trans isomerase SurA